MSDKTKTPVDYCCSTACLRTVSTEHPPHARRFGHAAEQPPDAGRAADRPDDQQLDPEVRGRTNNHRRRRAHFDAPVTLTSEGLDRHGELCLGGLGHSSNVSIGGTYGIPPSTALPRTRWRYVDARRNVRLAPSRFDSRIPAAIAGSDGSDRSVGNEHPTALRTWAGDEHGPMRMPDDLFGDATSSTRSRPVGPAWLPMTRSDAPNFSALARSLRTGSIDDWHGTASDLAR